ncbi:TetR/AcrR family transcriptional regulator [Spiractinospora alimapuensis]|uniref:TetR/AcrR family transcriptional regulator n=1 Tax=Spiractinospora alimapuensis TaxID=2820884 RepID=UPI001F321A5A|nr:TetR/AcrR family transcriptional regulator [Spiractinospora alimapuensis]QVQ53757.1 TetR/AcrR family transcriptional regulator [Spiractinospora alimapuensis]
MTGERPRGRPRLERTNDAIVAATLEILVEVGFAGLTIEGVAGRAGVSRPTVYRRAASKEALVVDALDASVPIIVPDTDGATLTEITRTVRRTIDDLGTSAMGGATVAVLAASAANPTLASMLRERYLAPRLGAIMDMVEAGTRSGSVRADLSPALVRDLLIGPLVYRWLVSGAPMSGHEAAQLSSAITDVLRPRESGSGR